MPCNTITTVQVKLKGEIVRMDMLGEVIQKLGNHVRILDNRTMLSWATGSYNKKTGVLIERSAEQAEIIKRNYASELTRRTLGRAGWQVKTVEQGGR